LDFSYDLLCVSLYAFRFIFIKNAMLGLILFLVLKGWLFLWHRVWSRRLVIKKKIWSMWLEQITIKFICISLTYLFIYFLFFIFFHYYLCCYVDYMFKHAIFMCVGDKNYCGHVLDIIVWLKRLSWLWSCSLR